MSIKVDIAFKGIEHVDEFVNRVAPEVVEASSRAAMNKTVTKIRTRATRGISRQSDIKPLKLIRKRMRLFKANPRRAFAGVRFDWAPMPAEALGEVKWSRFMPAARAGRYKFPGAFAGTPRKGKFANKRKRIYVRAGDTGSNKQDLHAQYKLLEPFRGILGKVGRRVVQQELLQNFGDQLAFRLRRGGYIK